jgi:hypothetical protein
MRWLRVAGAVMLLGLCWAGPAAAQPDHLHVDLALVGCETVQATGFELPENAANDVTLRRTTVTTGADGTMTLKAKVPLTGVKTVRMTVTRSGATQAFAFSELGISGPCPLPFTGPARWPTLAGLGLGLLAAGALLVRLSGHRPGRHAV